VAMSADISVAGGSVPEYGPGSADGLGDGGSESSSSEGTGSSAAFLLPALSSVGTVAMINVVGILAAMRGGDKGAEPGIFTKSLIQGCSQLCVVVFMPCLVITSLASTVDWDVFVGGLAMPLFAVVHVITGLAVAVVVRAIVKPPAYLHRPFLCALTFQNSSSVPLLVAAGLTASPPLSELPNAFEHIATYTFMYNIGWQVIFWSFGAAYLSASGDGGGGSTVWQSLKNGVQQPMLQASVVGLVVGLVPVLREGSEGGFKFATAAAEVLGSAGVPLVTCVMGATLGKSLLKHWGKRVSLTLPLVICFFRLIVVGGVQFLISVALTRLLMPADTSPYLKIALFVQVASPSANMNIVVLQKEGNTEAAEDLSLAFLLQYVLMLGWMLVVVPAGLNEAFAGAVDAAAAASATG
jgi:predicted permease